MASVRGSKSGRASRARASSRVRGAAHAADQVKAREHGRVAVDDHAGEAGHAHVAAGVGQRLAREQVLDVEHVEEGRVRARDLPEARPGVAGSEERAHVEVAHEGEGVVARGSVDVEQRGAFGPAFGAVDAVDSARGAWWCG